MLEFTAFELFSLSVVTLRVILSTLLHQCKLPCAPFLPHFFRFSPINFSNQNNLELHLGCHTCWLSYFTLVCLWCGRTAGGRAYGHVITKIFRMGRLPHFLRYGATLAWSSAIKQIDSLLPWVSSVIGHRRRQNMVKTSVMHLPAARVPLLCFYHILTSSVIY